jgi:NAD(P)-dependent dehydrogenase (short-subunit alcohol dehydrogenase family)
MGGARELCGIQGGNQLLMKSMAQELGPEGIRVNSISPGAVGHLMSMAVARTALDPSVGSGRP